MRAWQKGLGALEECYAAAQYIENFVEACLSG